MRNKDIRYYCKYNDNNFIIEFEDGEVNQILFGTLSPNDGWIVIGFEDLIEGLEKAGYVFFKKK